MLKIDAWRKIVFLTFVFAMEDPNLGAKNILDLPNEILVHIVQNLNSEEDIASFSKVSKHTNCIVKDILEKNLLDNTIKNHPTEFSHYYWQGYILGKYSYAGGIEDSVLKALDYFPVEQLNKLLDEKIHTLLVASCLALHKKYEEAANWKDLYLQDKRGNLWLKEMFKNNPSLFFDVNIDQNGYVKLVNKDITYLPYKLFLSENIGKIKRLDPRYPSLF